MLVLEYLSVFTQLYLRKWGQLLYQRIMQTVQSLSLNYSCLSVFLNEAKLRLFFGFTRVKVPSCSSQTSCANFISFLLCSLNYDENVLRH